MERVVLRVKEKLSSSKQQRLGFTILQSSKNLKVISISHQSDLCKLVVSVAEQCASLSRLESVRMNHEKSLSGTSSRAPVLSFSSKWRPQLHTLIWTCGAESLLCDEVLLERLRGARKVSISSYNLGLPWIVRLLARGSNLIDVRLRGNEKDAVENIPQMNLPYLEQLYLGKTPKSRSTGDSSLFFQSLKTPKLATLSLGGTVPEDLSFLTSESVPQQLVIDDLLIASSVSLPEAASSLVKSLKGMKELQALHLRFTASNSFWVHLLSLLTPLSKANIQDDQQYRVLLPQLISLEIGKEDICKHSTPLDPIHITSLLAARKAALNGCSFDQVSLVASGQSLEPSGALQEAAFETSKLTSQLRALRVEVPVKSDQKKQSWLKKNVFKVNVKWI